jgi:DNA-binding MarR family transcriptional regulator
MVPSRIAPAVSGDLATSVLEQHRASPGLNLALLGQEAMRRLRDAHTAHNLTPRQFQILGLLHDHGGLAQRELAQTMDVDPSILVGQLNPLEANGLVARERDSTDRRRHLVTLTPRGERHLTNAARGQKAAEDQLFATLTNNQRKQLGTLLLALRDGLATDPETACATKAER